MSPHWPVATTLHYSPRHKTRESERERERERHFPSFKKKFCFHWFLHRRLALVLYSCILGSFNGVNKEVTEWERLFFFFFWGNGGRGRWVQKERAHSAVDNSGSGFSGRGRFACCLQLLLLHSQQGLQASKRPSKLASFSLLFIPFSPFVLSFCSWDWEVHRHTQSIFFGNMFIHFLCIQTESWIFLFQDVFGFIYCFLFPFSLLYVLLLRKCAPRFG